jgi:hypothetical protein
VLPITTRALPWNVRLLCLPLHATTGPRHHVSYETGVPKASNALSLREIDRNFPAEEIKWKILDAMRSVPAAWEVIVPTAIQNCFVKCCLGAASSANADDV